MGKLNSDSFVCLDCEATGLDTNEDKIIEIASIEFTFDQKLAKYESLIDPNRPIPVESQSIHHISNEMVKGKPKIAEVLSSFLEKFFDGKILVGHNIDYDIALIHSEAKRAHSPCNIKENKSIDTLRLARLYGESPTNSLESLRHHFNIPEEGAHRAMSDVQVNIEVFKYLSKNFSTTEAVLERLKKPILLKSMPLGKHKGRSFREIPKEYLQWALRADFDQDLLYSIKTELKKRKEKKSFHISSNPFSTL